MPVDRREDNEAGGAFASTRAQASFDEVKPSKKSVSDGAANSVLNDRKAPERGSKKYSAKNVELKKHKRTEPLGERLDYPGGFPVYLARYVLFGGDTPHAAMRFYNGSDAVLTGIKFKVTEKDANGKIIAEYTLERRGLNVVSDSEFAVADCAVDSDCAALEVSLLAALSDPYEYIVVDDGVTVRYGVEEENKEFYFKNKRSCSVKKYRKILSAISLAVIVIVAAVAAVTVWRSGFFDGKGSADAENNTFIAVTENVET